MNQKDLPLKKEENEQDPLTVQFLLAEMSEIGEFWRHTDTQIDTSLNFYTTIGAILIPGILVFYQVVKDFNKVIIVVIPLCIGLIVLGTFLLGRITRSNILKTEYVYSVNQIRRYFLDKKPEIAEYIFLDLVDKNTKLITSEHYRISVHNQLIVFIIITNSLLTGITIGAILWIWSTLLPLATFLIALVTTVVTYLAYARLISLRMQIYKLKPNILGFFSPSAIK